MLIEIGYKLQVNKKSTEQNSWTYMPSDATELTPQLIAKANKFFKQFRCGLGYTPQQMTLTDIRIAKSR